MQHVPFMLSNNNMKSPIFNSFIKEKYLFRTFRPPPHVTFLIIKKTSNANVAMVAAVLTKHFVLNCSQ